MGSQRSAPAVDSEANPGAEKENKMTDQKANTAEAPAFSFHDLEISELAIKALTTEDSIGIPELGASASYYSCTTC
jgi:hypothetical protein